MKRSGQASPKWQPARFFHREKTGAGTEIRHISKNFTPEDGILPAGRQNAPEAMAR